MNEKKPIEAYPLSWPVGTPRTRVPTRSRFKAKSIADARDKISHEVRLLGGQDLIISTNLKLRNDGLPRSDQAQPADKGVAIFFRWQKAPRSIACDKWDRVEDNLYALALSVEAMRGLDRWGATDILQKAFQGFTALPAPGKAWWDVLQCRRDASKDIIEKQYRARAKAVHPDTGGSVEQMTELNKARDEGLRDNHV